MRKTLMVLVMGGAALAAGCGGSPTEVEVDPFPRVAGNWLGTWSGRGGSVQATLTLRQSGPNLEGSLSVGRDENAISGTVTEFGQVQIGGRDTGGGRVYFSEGPHLALSNQGSRLEGPVRRNSQLTAGRVLSEGGVLSLEKVL